MNTPKTTAIEAGDSKRIKQLRLAIVKKIPKFPNNRETLEALEAKSLSSLLIAYANWACRFVPPRPRKVTIEPTLTSDRRWKSLSADTKALLARASQGEDLNANLSLLASSSGFTPATASTAPSTDKWEDKDFLLLVMGYHHLHLSQIIEGAGHTKRTDDLLFAHVTRDRFDAIGFFDHSVFQQTDSASQAMTLERARLWEIFDRRNSIGTKPGQIHITGMIATSGHSLQHARLASDYARLIQQVDSRLDDLSYRSDLFEYMPHATVKAMKLSWKINYLDLGLFDRTANQFHVIRKGPL